MRRITINPNNPRASLVEIARASADDNLTDIGQGFNMDATPALTTQLLVTSPTLANTNLVLANLLLALQKGGLYRAT
jgi:hypothetical protein